MTTTRRRTSSTTKTPTRPTRAKTKNPFDITSSTHFDEYLLPFILFCAVVPLLGVGAYAWCQRSNEARLLVPPALVLIGGMAFFALWHEAKARTVHNRARAAAAAAWLFLQPAVTIIVGPTSYAWTTIWFLVGFAFGVWFIFRKQEVVRGDGLDEHAAEDPLAVKIGLHETTRAKVLEDSETRMRLRVTHRWDPQANVLKGFETVGRLKGLPATGLRIVPTDDSGVSEVELMKVDMLKHSKPWPGPSAPGQSIAVPCRVGTMQDGSPMELVRPGEPAKARSAIHSITMGMSGAGKTRFMMNEVAEMVTRRDVVIWLSDTSKSAQTTKPYLRPAIDWLVTSLAQTKLMVQAIDRIITRRAELLGQHDMEEWEPEAFELLGMPYLYVGFQEASRVLTDENSQSAIIRIGEAARSAGISLDFSLQRASFSNMPTDLRSVLGSGICFGVKEDVDATMVLSPDTIDAGARPEAWRVSKPGACYIEASHVDPTRWSMPGRTNDLDRQELREHIATWSPRMSKFDRASAEAAGDGYAQREVVTVEEWLRTVRGPRRLFAVPGRTATPNGTSNGTSKAAGASPNGTGPNTPNGTAVAVLNPEPFDPEDDPNDDTDEPTVEEVQQMAADDAAGMNDLLDQMSDPQDFGPEDLAAFMTVDPREEIDPNADPDVDLGETWAPGVPLTYEQRCAAFRDIVNLFFRAHNDPGHVDTTTEALFDEWRQVPGNAAGGDPRPSLSRLLRKAEAAGLVEDRGRGKWRLLREVTTWDPMERVLGDTDDDGE